jgi:23S rRNA pseudouridine2605 synthase
MTDDATSGDRIAKVMARSGVASRRDAERLILQGRVAVNGTTVTSPALDVRASDRITLDGKPIDAPQPPRLWLYYKPLGLVTSERDEKGRQTVFETLPEGLPRVMSVGRLDLNSEGLLLLTNDGELKRRLELPATGWLRRYRVRVNGMPTDATFDPLRRGVTIDGEEFQPMEITLDSQKGANAWLTVGLREGKNREVRRAMTEVGLTVNRLIRVSYGPFRLNEMRPGDVVEVRAKVMREQLGGLLEGLTGYTEPKPERTGQKRPRPAPERRPAEGPEGERARKPRHKGGSAGGAKPFARREDEAGRPARSRDAEGGRAFERRGPPQAGGKPGSGTGRGKGAKPYARPVRSGDDRPRGGPGKPDHSVPGSRREGAESGPARDRRAPAKRADGTDAKSYARPVRSGDDRSARGQGKPPRGGGASGGRGERTRPGGKPERTSPSDGTGGGSLSRPPRPDGRGAGQGKGPGSGPPRGKGKPPGKGPGGGKPARRTPGGGKGR